MADMSERSRRRLDEVFGDVLPSITWDETGEERDLDRDAAEADLLADRPPHHDRER